jgi:hypothetical protein
LDAEEWHGVKEQKDYGERHGGGRGRVCPSQEGLRKGEKGKFAFILTRREMGIFSGVFFWIEEIL